MGQHRFGSTLTFGTSFSATQTLQISKIAAILGEPVPSNVRELATNFFSGRFIKYVYRMYLTGVIPLEIVLRPGLVKANEKEVVLCCPTLGGATQLSLFLFLAVTRTDGIGAS